MRGSSAKGTFGFLADALSSIGDEHLLPSPEQLPNDKTLPSPLNLRLDSSLEHLHIARTRLNTTTPSDSSRGLSIDRK